MSKPRYSIVRVDDRCPDFFCKCKVMEDEKSFSCNDCKLYRKYGDTKEQMERKVIQILFKNAPIETYLPRYIEQKRKILETAKEIVEFLGVEK